MVMAPSQTGQPPSLVCGPNFGSVNELTGNDCLIPPNVAELVNFYQTRGLVHGCRAIRATDPNGESINLIRASHDRVRPAQILAVPVFMLAVAATWLIARALRRQGSSLMRPLLTTQFLLITCVLIFSAVTKPSANPDGVSATIAALIAVTAMGCQFALLRLTMPVAPSTAVMTGNLTNTVLALVDLGSRTGPPALKDGSRITGPLRLLVGFFMGCVLATVAILYLGDWAWSLPAALAAVALLFH